MKKVVGILAAVAFLASANVANAFWFPWFGDNDESNLTVNTNNSANVSNDVTTKANTGKNYTDAGSARVRVSGNGDNGGNTANGGDSDVSTGDATAVSDVLNDVNYTDIDIEADCGCEGDLNVNTTNSASVGNTVHTKANTGKNDTDAGSAKVKVEGGDDEEEENGGWWWFDWDFDDEDENDWNGENESNGGDSNVETGDAEAGSAVENYVNHTVVRIRR